MFDLDPSTDILICFALGLSALVVGVGSLVLKGHRLSTAGWIVPLGLGLLLGVPAIVMALSHTAYSSFGPLALLSSFFGTLALARSPLVEWASRLNLGFLRRAWIPSTYLAILGVSLIGWQVYALDRDLTKEIEASDKSLSVLLPQGIDPIPGSVVHTDTGHAIQLMRLVRDPASILETEATYMHSLGMDLHLIQTGPSDESYNCHGWVFGNGKAWISGESVDSILKDNHYQSVSQPTAGDVVIFRASDSSVAHSALVRAVPDDGAILLESKWGMMGRYIHTLEQHAYRNLQATFYHTTRMGHRLHTPACTAAPLATE